MNIFWMFSFLHHIFNVNSKCGLIMLFWKVVGILLILYRSIWVQTWMDSGYAARQKKRMRLTIGHNPAIFSQVADTAKYGISPKHPILGVCQKQEEIPYKVIFTKIRCFGGVDRMSVKRLNLGISFYTQLPLEFQFSINQQYTFYRVIIFNYIYPPKWTSYLETQYWNCIVICFQLYLHQKSQTEFTVW